jgi:competence protein ComEA
MENYMLWLRRPTVLAALACALVGLLLLFFGPTIRAALGASAPPAQPASLALADDLLLAPSPPAPSSEPAKAPPAPQAPAEVVVYISGAVARPDVYRLPGDARVKDLVLAAGGLSPDAAAAQINLAAPISDAQHVHVPLLGEAPAAPSLAAPSAGGAAAVGGDGLLDLNSASAADLEDLPGIGATIAERILAYRDEQGRFEAVDDLQQVSGIGAKLFERIAPLVTVR